MIKLKLQFSQLFGSEDQIMLKQTLMASHGTVCGTEPTPAVSPAGVGMLLFGRLGSLTNTERKTSEILLNSYG